MCPRPDTRPCELAQQGDVAFVGFVVRAEPRSFGDVLDEVQQKLPAKLVRAFQNGSLTTTEAREAIRYLVPQAERAVLLASSGADVQTYVNTRFFQSHVRIRVTEAFRGIEEQEVEFVTGFSSCDFKFQEHKSYLIYAGREKGSHQLSTGACSGNAPIETAGGELTYLRGLKDGTVHSQIFGFVTRDPWDNGAFGHVEKPVAGVPIVLKSEGSSWQVATDQEGAYEFTGLRSGSYEIAAALPNAAPGHASRKFDLKPGACLREDFLAIRTGSISGRLMDADGNPVHDVLVDIEAAPPTPQPEPFELVMADKLGSFAHTSLEAGDYVLGLNLKSPPNARDWDGKRVPYARSYYPGVTDRAIAQVIHLQPGQNIDNLEFRVPPTPHPLTVTGTVVWANGLPAKADVLLMDLGYPEESSQVDSARTKSDGRFSLTGAEGRSYVLFAHVTGCTYHFHSEALDLSPGDDKPIRLELSEKGSADACTICKRFTHLH
jgi:hypothetical protein